MRARIEVKRHEGACLVSLDRLRDQAIEGEGLVERALHQALIDVPLNALGRGPRLYVKRVETVEGALHADFETPALRRIRVGIGEVIEACRQRGIAMHGDSVGRRAHGFGAGQGCGEE
jgi:hypothetical protein